MKAVFVVPVANANAVLPDEGIDGFVLGSYCGVGVQTVTLVVSAEQSVIDDMDAASEYLFLGVVDESEE